MRSCIAVAANLVLIIMMVPIAWAADRVDYERDIRPLLLQKCASCHGALRQASGLRLDAGRLIHEGGDGGPVIVPGDSSHSVLLQRVMATDAAERMPPAGEGESLSEIQRQLLSDWIQQGAVFPENEAIPEDPLQYWSWKVPERPSVPVSRSGWARNPIDCFIEEQHQRLGLTAQPEAAPEVWLRRVFLDLTGLPPTQQELISFLKDSSESARELVVSDLLNRPAYGERWGRHWMDVWRYSDWYGSRGINEIRYSQRHIWRWRDWIVESLNSDKPYNQMIIEMVAGDELAPDDADVLRATGFLGRNWYKFDRNVWMFDAVEHTSQAFLGMTLKCARCHDHKYDPISQEDYYRFRSFFEPHDVRIDPVSGDFSTEKDATQGAVLKVGVSRVYDRTPDEPTFIFERGDSRYPDKSRPMTPAVPRAFPGAEELAVTPVPLPVSAWYPALRPEVSRGLLEQQNALVVDAEQAVADSREAIRQLQNQIAMAEARLSENASAPSDDRGQSVVFSDQFSSRSNTWKVKSGDWKWEDGKLVQRSVRDFATIVADLKHPQNFFARVRYQTLQPGSFRSVGFSFDYIDNGNSQDIYTSANDNSPTVQAFHRKDGRQSYPAAGIVKTMIRPGDETTVEIRVRGQQLALSLNGVHQLDYVMPEARREGQLSLWVHQGAAEFLEVHLEELVPTLDDLRKQLDVARHEAELASLKLRTTQLKRDSFRDRVSAETAKYGNAKEEVIRQASLQASQSERRVAVGEAQEALLQAEFRLNTVRGAALQPDDQNSAATPSPALEEASRAVEAARQKLAAAETAVDTADGTYTQLGDTHPRVSSGRRLALARWIADPENPRTARVAVNQIWMRHFGQPLVSSVSNFGLNGTRPTHPELLDWLADELVRSNWQMKALHRTLVLSAAYRQSATDESSGKNAAVDPENRYLWRMNSRRMEAEVVRDALLFVCGQLDRESGGPELAEGLALTSYRRSLYFRSTPNEKAAILETFDAASPNECYRRQESVVPQQALALMNSSLVLDLSRKFAAVLSQQMAQPDMPADDTAWITSAFQTILTRSPDPSELAACQRFLFDNSRTVQQANQPSFAAGAQTSVRAPSADPVQRARENLILVLLSHNEFVTIR